MGFLCVHWIPSHSPKTWGEVNPSNVSPLTTSPMAPLSYNAEELQLMLRIEEVELRNREVEAVHLAGAGTPA